MNILLLILIIAAVIGTLVYKTKRYQKTSYYKITKKPYWFLDKGSNGEYLIYEHLRLLENHGGKFLFNIYLPKGKGETTEIDVLLISPKGLFVFESKNYGGWIFGNDAHKSWTQVFPAGRGRSHKERFYNPVMQNASHIVHLKRFIGGNYPISSIIVFSDECAFRDVTIRDESVHVIHRYEVASTVAQIYEKTLLPILTEQEVDNVYSKLYPYTQVTREVRAQHAANLKIHQ